jgi:hypothetical protein
MIFLWRAMAADARRLGPGIIALLLLGIVVSFHAESRVSIFAYPFFVVLLACRAAPFANSNPAFWIFVVISMLFSKFWLRIDAYLPDGRTTDMGVPLHFMNHGPWMQNPAYVVHAVAVAISAVLLWRVGHHALRAGAESPADETAGTSIT